MAEIKTTLNLLKGDENGLVDLAATLAEEIIASRNGGPPPKVRAALVLLIPLRVTTEGGEGKEVVTMQALRAEFILDKDLEEAREFIMRSLQARGGQEPLSLEFERDIERAFGGASFTTPPPPEGGQPLGPDADGPPDEEGGPVEERSSDRLRREVGDMFRPRDPEDEDGQP